MAESSTPVDLNPLTDAGKRYYASRSGVSALGDANRFAPNRRGRPGQPLQAVAQSPMKATDSADKYYTSRDQLSPKPGQIVHIPVSRGRTVERIEKESVARPQAGKVYADESGQVMRDLVRPLIVLTPDEAAAAVQTIVDLLNAGQSAVLVQVGDDKVEQRIRTGLEFRVARGEIDEAKYRDVKYSLAPRDASELADQTFGKIDDKVAAAIPAAAEDDPLPTDFDAFVKSGGDELPRKEDASPTVASGAVSVSAVEETAVREEKKGRGRKNKKVEPMPPIDFSGEGRKAADDQD